jgi:hypothetical protein
MFRQSVLGAKGHTRKQAVPESEARTLSSSLRRPSQRSGRAGTTPFFLLEKAKRLHAT